MAFKVALRETARNKMRLIVACLISLILFLAAFILINLSYALPRNFNKYYEQFFAEDLRLKVNNADMRLVNGYDEYFKEISIDNDFIKERFVLRFGSNSFTYTEAGADSDNPELVHKYRAEYCERVNAEELLNNAEVNGLLLSGTLWNAAEADNSSIWLSDRAANALQASVGDFVKLGLDTDGSNEYIYDTYTVKGIYSYPIYKNIDPNPPVLFMTESKANSIYFSQYETYKIIGKVRSVSVLYDVYNALMRNYDVEDSVQVDMIISVKNTEAICAIIGVCMLIGGLIVLMNFITMFISTNKKGIGLMMALGARSTSVTIGYGMIFAFLLAIIGLITLIIIPSVNYQLSAFIFYIGYQFEITTNYWLLLTLYIVSNIGAVFIMLYENFIIKRLTPIHVLKEED